MADEQRAHEIWKRLSQIDYLLRIAANEYERATRAVREEKEALIQERLKMLETEQQ
jgi:hypothetical protein